MTAAQGWTLIGGVLLISLAFVLVQTVLLIRLVRSEVDGISAKLDQVADKVEHIRRWLDSRDA
jgi:hypothetical protein